MFFMEVLNGHKRKIKIASNIYEWVLFKNCKLAHILIHQIKYQRLMMIVQNFKNTLETGRNTSVPLMHTVSVTHVTAVSWQRRLL